MRDEDLTQRWRKFDFGEHGGRPRQGHTRSDSQIDLRNRDQGWRLPSTAPTPSSERRECQIV